MSDQEDETAGASPEANLPRIVSLVPSSTETLLALGAHVIACSRFCEQPHLRHVGGTKNPDIAAILELAPDVVVLDREENRLEDHDALVAAGLNVFTSDVTDVAAGLDVVGELARVSNTVSAEAVQELLRSGLDRRAGAPAGTRRTAFVPIWRRPWMTISPPTYGASVLAELGVDLVPVADPAAYPAVELGEIAALHPDLIVVPSEPYVFTPPHLDELAAAMPEARIVEVDGQDLFWWGIRTPDAITRLAAALEPPATPGPPIHR